MKQNICSPEGILNPPNFSSDDIVCSRSVSYTRNNNQVSVKNYPSLITEIMAGYLNRNSSDADRKNREILHTGTGRGMGRGNY